MNKNEIIHFTNESSKSIEWTADRRKKFGVFPEVEVYLLDETNVHYKSAVQPVIDAPPPSFTMMTFDFGGLQSGFISIK